MIFSDLIDVLVDPNKMQEFYSENNINTDSEALIIYMKDKIDFDSEISIFEVEETEDEIFYSKNGIEYVQLFPIFYAKELMENDLQLLNKGYTYDQIANRLIEYRLRDA